MNMETILTPEYFWRLSPYGDAPYECGTADDVMSAIPHNAPTEEAGDFWRDGELFCGKCGAQKSVSGGTVAATCECFINREREAKAAEELKDRKERCFSAKKYYDCSLSKFDGSETARKLAQLFCDNWQEMLEKGYGLILYGGTGTGKTWLAAALCNEVMAKGYGAKLISVGEIELRVDAGESLGKIVQDLNRYPLIVLDDYGAERTTSYMHSNLLTLMDARQNSGKATLLTTNLTLDQLTVESRLNSRAFENKVPVAVTGRDRRRDGAQAAERRMKELWAQS